MNTEPQWETEQTGLPVALIGQAVESLHRGLKTLPKAQRQALLLHKIAGLTPEEIAVRLGVGLNAVERNIAGAIAHLQRTYFIGERI